MRDQRNPPKTNPRNATKYTVIAGPWAGTIVTPIGDTTRPGIILATDGNGKYIQIETANLKPAHKTTKASTLA